MIEMVLLKSIEDRSLEALILVVLTREHREPGLTDWNAALWVFRVAQNKNNGVFHFGQISTSTFSRITLKVQQTEKNVSNKSSIAQ